MKILVADDSLLIRKRVLDVILKIDKNNVIYEASNGVEVMNLINEIEVDVLILDINMPFINGLKVLKLLREKKLNIIVIILTNYSNKLYREKSFDAGTDYYFNKSDEFEKLQTVLYELLNK